MIRARILTPWIGTGQSGDPYRAQIAGDYALDTCVDVTGQPVVNLIPGPNLVTVEIKCGQAVYDAVAADPNYTVLWSEPA